MIKFKVSLGTSENKDVLVILATIGNFQELDSANTAFLFQKKEDLVPALEIMLNELMQKEIFNK